MNPLYEIRMKLGKTQEEMASYIQKKTLRKTDQQCVSKWEASSRVPHYIAIKAYSELARCDPERLAQVLNKLKDENLLKKGA